MSATKTRVVIVDDHPIVRHGLKVLINSEADLEVCGEASSIQEARSVISELNPELALVDLSLKDESGLDLIKDLRVRHPNLRILVVSIHNEAVYAERVLRTGALGYVAKQEATYELLQAIRKVLEGEVYVSERVTSSMLGRMSGKEGASPSSVEALTDRELQVFQLIGSGKTTREIAKTLHLSIKTIETYRSHIKTKLELRNATELVQRAANWVQEEGIG